MLPGRIVAPTAGVRRPLVVGTVGSLLVLAGGAGSSGTPVSGGPPSALGLPGAAFGHGLVLSLVVTWTGVGLLLLAWLALGPRAVRGRLATSDAVWATALWALPLVASVPVFSRDAWSYLAQGAMLTSGVSPYEYGPAATPGPYTDEVAPDWKVTVTPYGPLHLLVTRAMVAVSGGHPTLGLALLRMFSLAALAVLVVGVIALARRTRVDAGAALWAATASPLVVLHLVGGLHNDGPVLALGVVAVVAALDGRRVWAGVAVGLALSLKITVVVAAPFLLWILVARRVRAGGRAHDGRGFAADLLVVPGVAVAVTAAITAASGTGLGWLGALSVSDRVINYLSLPTVAAHLASPFTGFDDGLAVTRTVSRAVLLVVLVVVWWTHRHGTRSAMRGIVVALVAFMLLNTVSWPWYFVWPAAFWATAAPGRRTWAAGAGVVVFLVLALGPNGSTSLYTPALALPAAVLSLATAWWFARATRTGSVRTPSPARVA